MACSSSFLKANGVRLIWQVECQLSLVGAPPSARGWPLAALVSQLGELPRPSRRGRCVDDVTRSCHRGGTFCLSGGPEHRRPKVALRCGAATGATTAPLLRGAAGLRDGLVGR